LDESLGNFRIGKLGKWKEATIRSYLEVVVFEREVFLIESNEF
jgi:hypothetical protein